ncbi:MULTISPECIES: hypothetical protein [unclassified Kribbella]|uniref:hypothetical protein n=1 Tax=unclassified Kribbella TaxID=2644121 RepID=UPI00301B439C
MTDIDKARAQRDALRNVARRTVGGTSRAEQALQRYLGVGLYEARHAHDKKDAGHATDAEPPDETSH